MSPEELRLHEADEQKRKLDRHFAGGLAWTAGAKWATQFITWGSLLIYARLLSTADFGLVEMAAIYTLLTNMLAEFGVGTAVLHMPELDRRRLGQLHSFSCIVCSAMFCIASLGAPLIAGFFRTPDLRLLIVVNNIAFFITGFQAVPMGLMQRKMDYRRLSVSEALQAVTQAGVTVIAAKMGLGYWSLVAGPGCGKVLNAILVNIWNPVPFAIPRWNDIRAPIAMGWQVAVGRVAWAAYSSSDGIIVGRVLGESLLGTYRMAMNLATAPAEKISTMLMRTAGPLFANVQGDLVLVRRYFLVMAEALNLAIMPLLIGLAILAPSAVPIVLGEKWAPAAPPLQWLAVFMILRTMAVLIEQVLVSQRATRFTMRMSLLNFIVMPLAFLGAANKWGTPGVAASWLLLSPLTILPFVVVLVRTIQLPYRALGAVLWPAIAGSTIMGLGLLGVRKLLAGQTPPAVFYLAAQVGAGAVIYAVVVLGFFRRRLARYAVFIRDIRRSPLAAAH